MDNVSNIASPQDDGAGEKLVDEKNGHNSKGVEVKYMTPTSQNGDAKIDIENLKSAFAGMGKEELMKFASDPFWVRTRWFLFVLFWLLWVAMLAGAISIIVLAPKCAPPTPREWWEQSPLYKTNVATFTKGTGQLQGDLKAFSTKLDYLKSLGIKTVVLSNILKVSNKTSDGVDEFKTILPSYGTLEDLKSLISAARAKDIQLLLTLVPNHSSLRNTLFIKSASKDPQYASFYVWAPGKGFNSEGQNIPPNNWLSKTGGSAWEWNEERQEFYLHQFDNDEPEFNFHNPDVVKYFSEVMQFWLDLGVSGFYLERTPYLVEDKDLGNETQKRSKEIGSATHTDYEFYSHVHTENRPELASVLRSWKEVVINSSGILVVDDISISTNRSVAHLIVKPQIMEPFPAFSVESLYNLINTTLAANPWPAWKVEMNGEPEGSEFSKGLLLATMLLPGVPVTVAGQELGLSDLQEIPWDNSTGSHDTDVVTQQNNDDSMYNAYKELVRARTSPSILHGTLELHIFNGTSVFAYTRIKSGTPGYLVVFNTGSEETVVDVQQLNTVPEELTLVLTSHLSSMADEKKVESIAVSLPGRAVAVFSYVAKAKE